MTAGNPILDITPLRSLVAVAACGGFHRAATALHLTQSAVSQHIRRLESVTGKQLVERTGRITRFTADGEILLAEARTILAAHDAAIRRMGVLDEQPTITVGTTEYGADWALPYVSQILREHCPQRPVHFRLDRSQRIEASADIDVAVYHQPVRENTEILGPVLGMQWFAAPDFAATFDVDDPTTPLPLIVFDEPCSTRGIATELLVGGDVSFTVAVESADLAGVLTAVRSGLGVVLLPVIGRIPEGLRRLDHLPTPPGCALQLRFSGAIPESAQRAIRASLDELAERNAPDGSVARGAAIA